MIEQKTIYTADELMAFEDERPIEVQLEGEYRRGYMDGFMSATSIAGNCSDVQYSAFDKMLFDWKNRAPVHFELPPV